MSGAGSGRCALVTGGAGFNGTNVAERLLDNGERVIVFDSSSRRRETIGGVPQTGVREGVRLLYAWFCDMFGARPGAAPFAEAMP